MSRGGQGAPILPPPPSDVEEDTVNRAPLAERVKSALAGPPAPSAPSSGPPPPRPSTRPPAPESAPITRGSGRRPRRARLRLTRIDPWTVMKTSFLLSIALGIVTVVAVFIVWTVLGAAGVWDSINQTVQSTIGGEDSSDFNISDYVGLPRVMGFTMLVAVIDVVLLTAIATLMAFLYNMSAALLGGIEMTLAEDEN
jgi:hypothetical protein